MKLKQSQYDGDSFKLVVLKGPKVMPSRSETEKKWMRAEAETMNRVRTFAIYDAENSCTAMTDGLLPAESMSRVLSLGLYRKSSGQ